MDDKRENSMKLRVIMFIYSQPVRRIVRNTCEGKKLCHRNDKAVPRSEPNKHTIPGGGEGGAGDNIGNTDAHQIREICA